MWKKIESAPRDRDIHVAVIDENGLHELLSPCRRVPTGWIDARSGAWLDVRPTHWRDIAAIEETSAN